MLKGHKNQYKNINGDKNSISKISSDIRQSSLCINETVNTSKLRSKGWRIPNKQSERPFLLWRGLNKSSHLVRTTSLFIVQRSMEDLYTAVEGPSKRPIKILILNIKK